MGRRRQLQVLLHPVKLLRDFQLRWRCVLRCEPRAAATWQAETNFRLDAAAMVVKGAMLIK